MLVLQRKKNERLVIGENPPAIIQVLAFRKGNVRLGITAHPSVLVRAFEDYQKMFGDPSVPRSRSAGCPTLAELTRYACRCIGLEEKFPESIRIREHLKSCLGCRQDFRRKIPIG